MIDVEQYGVEAAARLTTIEPAVIARQSEEVTVHQLTAGIPDNVIGQRQQ